MKYRTIMAVMIARREDVAIEVQKLLTKHGCIIGSRLGLHEASDICDQDGLVLLALGGTKKEIDALAADLRKTKGVKVKSLQL